MKFIEIKEAAKQIRADLKKEMPESKFSVRRVDIDHIHIVLKSTTDQIFNVDDKTSVFSKKGDEIRGKSEKISEKYEGYKVLENGYIRYNFTSSFIFDYSSLEKEAA